MIRLNSQGPAVGAHGVRNVSGDWQECHNSVTGMPRSVAGPSSAIPCDTVPPEGMVQYHVRNPTTTVPTSLIHTFRSSTRTNTGAMNSTNNNFSETQSPAICCTALGMNPRMYARFLVDHKLRLTSKLQVRSAPPRFNSHAPTADGGPHENQVPAMHKRDILVLPLTRTDNPGMVREGSSSKATRPDTNLVFSSYDRPQYLSVGRTSH